MNNSIADVKTLNQNDINANLIYSYYRPLIRSVELLNTSNFNSLYCIGKAGIGKSHIIDETLERIKADYIVFSGDISDAKLFAFMQENSDKIIVFRDVGRLLRKISFIELLKAATDTKKKRIISRMTYATHEGVEDSFEFTGKIIIEMNELSKRNKEDIEALISRGILVMQNYLLLCRIIQIRL